MIRTILTLALGMIIGVTILSYVYESHNINEDVILKLQSQNYSLLNENLKIDSINNQLHKKLAIQDNEIQALSEKDIYLKNTINDLNTRIKTLNKKYEKANNYSNNYNSNEISSYFSDLR